ncbi:type II secretion system protein [Cerasicoccus fimbriatus]|uniref:type II secretion system protein n=1 Tax=Cerasicoccus fimbriatus TaxID=3014554 RepID=UPI0022B4BC32|nr:type II secretion system protein [Cerasicoccus sp. TK19100]
MSNRRAFTLIELLTVVAIVGILAAIIMTSLGRVKNMANLSAATSQMRSVGAAVLMYKNDNNNLLPGPLSPPQRTAYDPTAGGGGQLATQLAPYLESNYSTERTLSPAFLTPAAEAAMEGHDRRDIVAFMLNMQMGLGKRERTLRPWGSTEGNGDEPKSYSVIDTEDWGFVEADQQLPFVKGSIAGDTPAYPVHGDVRLAWFFDGSVQAVGLDYFDDYGMAPGGGGPPGGGGRPGGGPAGGGPGGGGPRP